MKALRVIQNYVDNIYDHLEITIIKKTLTLTCNEYDKWFDNEKMIL